MDWCEQEDGVDFIFGLARNQRLKTMIEVEMDEVVQEVDNCMMPRRRFKELRYQIQKTWTGERRVVAKLEALPSIR